MLKVMISASASLFGNVYCFFKKRAEKFVCCMNFVKMDTSCSCLKALSALFPVFLSRWKFVCAFYKLHSHREKNRRY